jgi:hypothetical protein
MAAEPSVWAKAVAQVNTKHPKRHELTGSKNHPWIHPRLIQTGVTVWPDKEREVVNRKRNFG